jgi:hypothetical protein
MRIERPLHSGLTLNIDTQPAARMPYPTARIQRGWILLDDGEELCEEGVGFGVPVLKRGLKTIFPGALELFPAESGDVNVMQAQFRMSLEEKLTRGSQRIIDNPILYGCKNFLASLIRRLPALRKLLTGTSNLLRSRLEWETTYESADFSTELTLVYSIDPARGRLSIILDIPESLPGDISEVIIMNEQGARYFDQYSDSAGMRLSGDAIGCWEQVTAAQAAFSSSRHQVSFSLSKVTGARLYMGRELVGSRLAWSGFGYSFPPSLDHFSCEITINRLT